ncbi:hypothetical protein CHGG_03612 [Chaetomium globosum CBS 148.51]|uniref:CSC1/OSCA1-like 7TM region domain-containing protein n=1 Tax=Chaetomium globosum (strain ATCC 6205 / CBS 148.51 / DSM 1962 / NBRC 6347 / NRRL 1970) TaxID=306901 RepID=Q2H842_CHAGB|nr:uncharacterized protein CHGG_03612 [Chaetomium globosum CBS 148.51]EAQ91677.1 hypothetical protein CHGG_03612 [Chaetomium globosum CBS 148.51]
MDWVTQIVHLERRVLGINESDDGRIGSGRNDSDGGGTLVNFNPAGDDKKSESLASLGSTFIPVVIYSAICFLIFFVFRRKCHRVYAARTLPSLREPETPSPELPDGWFNWIKPFFAIKDDYILNNCSLDGFFFLRFLRMLSIICLAGVVVVWPVLLPINATGASGLLELDSLTIGNVKLASKYYAHVLVAWCFFGFVLFMICRECIYYVNLRQAYLLSPNYSKRLSSRTVLFTCIPKPYLEEATLRKVFGDSAKNIWIVKDTSAVRALVEDREETADRLQQAEVRLIRLANASRQRHLNKYPAASTLNNHLNETDANSPRPSQNEAEKGHVIDTSERFTDRQLSVSDSPTLAKAPDPEYTHPYGLDPSLPDVRGSVAALWLPVQSRPHHRPLRNFGRRVDTIRWTRARLKVLNKDIWKLRRKFRGGDGSPLNAAFIEFDSQASAQAGFQILAHHQPLHMSPCYIGLQPDEIIWSTLRIRWWEHIMRRFFMMGVIAVAIVFWSIPAALAGMVTNIKSLSETIFFLEWVMLLPGPILGVIQGLLPALALSWLMAAVPWMLRGCARVAGVPSRALVELYVQHAYFFFQVVQVFLVTTLTSAASAAVFDIIQNPLMVKDMLSENLPKASNFYLSYILIQCLAAGTTRLANVGDLIRHEVIAKTLPNPRRRFYRWRKMREVHWGSEFPRFTNLGVIAISYSCIAPMVLVFAGLGMFFTSYIYRYNLIYVYDTGPDSKGLFYPRALMQLMTGLYIAEICLIGLFALKSSVGPLLLMAIFLGFTALVHISLSEAMTPLLNKLPRTLALEKDMGPIAQDEQPGDDTAQPAPYPTGGLAADYYNMTDDDSDSLPGDAPNHDLDTDIQLRGIEGSSSLKYQLTQWSKSLFKSTFTTSPQPSNSPHTTNPPSNTSRLTRILTHIKLSITPDPSRPPNMLLTFLHPEIYQSFRLLQPRINPGPDPDAHPLPADYAKRAYWPPEMWTPVPRLWLPRDDARVSRQEVAHCVGAVAAASDRACWLADTTTAGKRARRRWGGRVGGGGVITTNSTNAPG